VSECVRRKGGREGERAYLDRKSRHHQHQRAQHAPHALHTEHRSQVTSTILRGGGLSSNSGSHGILAADAHAHDEAEEHHLLPDVHTEELRGLGGKEGGREGGREGWLVSDEAKEHHLQPDIHAEELRGLVGRGGREGGREGGRISVWLERREGREKTSCLFTKRSCQPAKLIKARKRSRQRIHRHTNKFPSPHSSHLYLSVLPARRP